MPSVAQLANNSSYSGVPGALTGAGAVRHAGLGTQTLGIYATMQGQRVLMQDLYTTALITPMMLHNITLYMGIALRETAKIFHTPNIDTKATYDSINSSFGPLPGGAQTDVWVGTDYSKFLEFGFVHHGSGQWIFNPFMIPAADIWIPAFIDAVQQTANISIGVRGLTGPGADTPANDILQQARGALYSYSKYAGDIQVLGFGGLSAGRGIALKGAQGLGNIQAARQGTLAARSARVAAGRVGGRFGRTGLVSGFSPGQVFTGPSARLYNRIGGRLFGGGLSRIGNF